MVLLVSKLATNALRHGGGTCALDLTACPDSITVAVHDRSPRAPRMCTPDLNGDTGGSAGPWSTGSLAPSRRLTGHPVARPSAPASPGNTAALDHSGIGIVVGYTAGRPSRVAPGQ